MMEIAAFCRSHGDMEGCRGSLVEAWLQGLIKEYCIFEGLRANWYQSRQVLLTGLYDKASSGADPPDTDGSTLVGSKDLRDACKDVVLVGYPQDIKALREVFYEAFYRLVRTTIHRFGISDDGRPSADDVFQEVFMGMHKLLVKGASIKGRFTRSLIPCQESCQ